MAEDWSHGQTVWSRFKNFWYPSKIVRRNRLEIRVKILWECSAIEDEYEIAPECLRHFKHSFSECYPAMPKSEGFKRAVKLLLQNQVKTKKPLKRTARKSITQRAMRFCEENLTISPPPIVPPMADFPNTVFGFEPLPANDDHEVITEIQRPTPTSLPDLNPRSDCHTTFTHDYGSEISPHKEEHSASYTTSKNDYGNKVTPRKRQSLSTAKEHNLLLVPLDMGWQREISVRSTAGRGGKSGDIYYKPPQGKKLRSSVQMEDYLRASSVESWCLGLSVANFSFSSAVETGHQNETIHTAQIKPKRIPAKIARISSSQSPLPFPSSQQPISAPQIPGPVWTHL